MKKRFASPKALEGLGLPYLSISSIPGARWAEKLAQYILVQILSKINENNEKPWFIVQLSQ